ncbi:Coenzyme PQQ synthesis protein D (PqqD) [compost metagenome]
MKVRIHQDVIVYEENDEILLINMLQNNFYSLDFVSSTIWRKIEEYGELSKIIDSISDEFNESKDSIAEDVKEFVNDLLKVGVVEKDE